MPGADQPRLAPVGVALTEPVWVVSDEVRQRYLLLFRRFLDERTSAQHVSERFLDMWRNDSDADVTTGEVVDVIMTSVDCYEPVPDPTSYFEIDEAQLQAEVAAAAERLVAQSG